MPPNKLSAHSEGATAPASQPVYATLDKRPQVLLIADDPDLRLELIRELLEVDIDVTAVRALKEGVAEALDGIERPDVVLGACYLRDGALLPALEMRAEQQAVGERLSLAPMVLWAPRGLATVSQHVHFLARHTSQVLPMPLDLRVAVGLALYYIHHADA